jgi:hypothetical protein
MPLGAGIPATLSSERNSWTQQTFQKVQLEHDPEKWVPLFGKDHAPTMS